MYAKPVVIYQGIDNPLQVRVRNQEQASVNMTPYVLQVDIQDPLNSQTVQSFGVDFQNIEKGFGTFIIPRDIVNTLDQRRYKLTFRVIKESDNTERPAYVDDNYLVPMDLVVMPGYYTGVPPGVEETEDYLKIDGGTI